MDPAQREADILEKAVEHFAAEGFGGSTHDLARKIGITQSLLYRYFPTKEALFQRVFERVYLARWNPQWSELLRDRSLPAEQRLKRYYLDYAHTSILRNDWVRVLIFAGLKQAGINEKLFTLLRERVYTVVVAELRRELRLPKPRSRADAEMEIELVWGLHASIFYLGMRKWVYQTDMPKDVDALIESLVEGFVASFKHFAAKRAASR